jgi:cysteinyl-tRNA synthetase
VLHLYDTATGAVRPVDLRVAGKLSMYVCGPTVYSDPHVGHGRFTIVWDVLRRYATWAGLEVRYVSNVTDIDDKIIARAAFEERSTESVASTYEQRWFDTMAALGIDRPDDTPHATGYVEDMIRLIGELIDGGHAYPGGDGVYFASESIEGYGLLARQPLESLRAGARVEVSDEAGKHSPVDFALWKFAKPGEPAWEAPWGAGRPGWHTECVVMAIDLLGRDFDLHGGGNDLAFPHHENERAQACAVGAGFAHHWVHSGMVVADGGEKMSKSLGNTMSLPELVERWDPRAYRLLVLQGHYRSPLTVSDGTLTAATRTLERLDTFARDFAPARGGPTDAGATVAFAARMDDDLDTPGAVADLFGLLQAARAASGSRAAELAATVFELFEEALGLPLRSDLDAVPDDVAALAADRDRARAVKDWAAADRIRDELTAAGFVVEDGPSGTVVRRS